MSFGAQWVIEPEGQYMLTSGAKRHFRKGEAKVFGAALEEALWRFMRVRKHERGSPEEAEAIKVVKAEVASDWKNKHPYFVDPDFFTKEVFQAKVGLPTRFPGVLKQKEPSVRRQVAELLGRYAEKEGDEGFRPGGDYYPFFGVGVAAYLDDPVPEVRHAAATALYQFTGKSAPDSEGAELVAAAREMWDEAVEEFDSKSAAAGEGAAVKEG